MRKALIIHGSNSPTSERTLKSTRGGGQTALGLSGGDKPTEPAE